MKRVMGVVALALFACGLVLAGCESSDAGASSTGTGGPTVAASLHLVSVDGKWGYIDKTGTLVIKPQFEWAFEFSEGLAMAAITENGVPKYGYIDKTGAWVIQPQFDKAYPFTEGLAKVVTLSPGRSGESANDILFGFIDKTGDLVIPAQYTSARSFSEGLAVAAITENGVPKYGYIDKTGAWVIRPRFENAPGDFSEGLAALGANGYVFIDQKGNEVLHLPGGMVSALWGPGFSEGLAVVRGPFADSGGLMGYIDKTGAVVIKLQFDLAYDFSEGLAVAAVTENGVQKWGYIDKTGAWVIQPQFDYAGSFTEGLAVVGTLSPGRSGESVNDSLYSFIDKTGKVVIKLQQGQVPSWPEQGQVGQVKLLWPGFSGGIARVDTFTAAGETVPDSMTYIDTSGKVIWQGQ